MRGRGRVRQLELFHQVRGRVTVMVTVAGTVTVTVRLQLVGTRLSTWGG